MKDNADPINQAEHWAARVWTEHLLGSADSTVVATRSGEAGKRHYVTYVAGTFDGETSGRPRLILIEGATTKMQWHVDEGGWSANFAPPLEIGRGEDVKIQLNSGGAGVTGQVNMAGFTVTLV